MSCVCCSVGKVRLDTALELSLYLSRETEIMAVTQGFGELVPLYKLMEKRDMAELENQMKVSDQSERRMICKRCKILGNLIVSFCSSLCHHGSGISGRE